MNFYLQVTPIHDLSDFLLILKVIISDLLPWLHFVGSNPARNHNHHLGRPEHQPHLTLPVAQTSHPFPVCCTDASLTENFHRPPISSLLSKHVGSSPSSRQLLMAARPLTPAPMMATFLFMGAWGEVQRSLPASFLRTYFSVYLFRI